MPRRREREVLGSKSPLFGRRTAQIRLRPFGYREAAEFHPSWSRVNQARAYFVCGDVPLYLRSLAPDRSFENGVARALFDEHAPLGLEPEFLLREELRGVEVYNAVLLALAAGHSTVKTIAGASGEMRLHETCCARAMDQLAKPHHMGALVVRQRPGCARIDSSVHREMPADHDGGQPEARASLSCGDSSPPVSRAK